MSAPAVLRRWMMLKAVSSLGIGRAVSTDRAVSRVITPESQRFGVTRHPLLSLGQTIIQRWAGLPAWWRGSAGPGVASLPGLLLPAHRQP